MTDGPAERSASWPLEHGVLLHELSPQHASLEEAFIALTADSVEYRTGPRAHRRTPRRQPRRSPADRRKGGLTHVRTPAVLRSEWAKISSVRSTVWTLAAAFAVTVGFGTLISALSNNELRRPDAARTSSPSTPTGTSFTGVSCSASWR